MVAVTTVKSGAKIRASGSYQSALEKTDAVGLKASGLTVDLYNIENVIGSTGSDTVNLHGTLNGNFGVINLGKGNDTLRLSDAQSYRLTLTGVETVTGVLGSSLEIRGQAQFQTDGSFSINSASSAKTIITFTTITNDVTLSLNGQNDKIILGSGYLCSVNEDGELVFSKGGKTLTITGYAPNSDALYIVLDGITYTYSQLLNSDLIETVLIGAVEATDVLALAASIAPDIINATQVTAINGAVSDILSVIALGNITLPTDFDSTLAAGSATADDIAAIEAANGAGAIDGSALTDIDGTAAAVVQAVTDLDTDPANFNTTLAAGAAAAADITSIEGSNGTGTIDGSALTAIDGAAAAVVQAVTDLDTDPANFNTTLAAGAAAAADITSIEGSNGTGTIDGSALTAIDGTAAAVVQAVTDLDTDPTNFNSTLTGAFVAADINTIGSNNGTGTITYNGTADGANTADTLDFTGVTVAMIINGNDGDDIITAGSGDDTITGGAGSDTFVQSVSTTGGALAGVNPGALSTLTLSGTYNVGDVLVYGNYDPSPDEYVSYEVKAGDTLNDIATGFAAAIATLKPAVAVGSTVEVTEGAATSWSAIYVRSYQADTITDFATGSDVLELSAASLNLLLNNNPSGPGAGDDPLAARGAVTAYYTNGDTGATLAFASFNAASADTAASGQVGTFIYDEVNGNLYLDQSGDTTWTDATDTLTDAAGDDILIAVVGSITGTDIQIIA